MVFMAKVKKNERFVPVKNYVIVVLMAVGVIALVLYAFCWRKVLQESKYATSYLIQSNIISNEIKDLEDLKDVFSEAPETYYIYISYTGSEDIYKMEKELAALIKEYNIGEQMYLLNITSIKNEDNYIDKINEALQLTTKKVTKVPTIVYYRDGKVIDIIKQEGNNIMNIGDFEKLLNVNKVEKDQ